MTSSSASKSKRLGAGPSARCESNLDWQFWCWVIEEFTSKQIYELANGHICQNDNHETVHLMNLKFVKCSDPRSMVHVLSKAHHKYKICLHRLRRVWYACGFVSVPPFYIRLARCNWIQVHRQTDDFIPNVACEILSTSLACWVSSDLPLKCQRMCCTKYWYKLRENVIVTLA